MKITITDHRSESRDRAVQRDIDGTILSFESTASDASRRAYHRVYNNTVMSDDRTVTARIEEGDHDTAGVPRWIEVEGDRQVSGYFVERIDIEFRRSAHEGKHSKWSQTVVVRGANRKKDGQPGLKPQSFNYPTRSWTQVGVWTADDINPDHDPESYWGKKERERVGEPKMDRVLDPMPGWLQAIIDRVHPETGELPYRWTPTHLFGSFVEHSWNPEVGIQLQEIAR